MRAGDGSQGIKGSIVLSSTICSTILDQWASLRSKRQTFTELVPNSIAGDPGLEGATCAAQKGYTAVTLGVVGWVKKISQAPLQSFPCLPSSSIPSTDQLMNAASDAPGRHVPRPLDTDPDDFDEPLEKARTHAQQPSYLHTENKVNSTCNIIGSEECDNFIGKFSNNSR